VDDRIVRSSSRVDMTFLRVPSRLVLDMKPTGSATQDEREEGRTVAQEQEE